MTDKDAHSDSWLAKQVRNLGCNVECAVSVESFLDRGDKVHRSVVLIDVDVFDPGAVHNVVKLRTHFGDGPSTHIIAMTSFSPGAFDNLLVQAGCDLSVTKSRQLDEVLAATTGIVESIKTTHHEEKSGAV